jgi:hypothetical protein
VSGAQDFMHEPQSHDTRRDEQPMSTPFLDRLRLTNKTLADSLARLSGGEFPTPIELQCLSDSIEQTGQAWRSNAFPPNPDQAMEAEIARYKENLRRLKSTLEKLRPELEERRASLSAGLTRFEATLRWAATLKQTR